MAASFNPTKATGLNQISELAKANILLIHDGTELKKITYEDLLNNIIKSNPWFTVIDGELCIKYSE